MITRRLGTHSYPAPVARFRERPLRIRSHAPLLGQHNREVLQDLLGVSDERYAQLLDDDIIGTRYLDDAT